MADLIGAGTAAAGAEVGTGIIIHGYANAYSRLAATAMRILKDAIGAVFGFIEARLREIIRVFISLFRGMLRAMARNPSVGFAMMVFWRELLFG